MPLKAREQIESDIVSEMAVNQNEITVFEPKTAIRGLISAFAGVVRELWDDLYSTRRKLFLNTSSGSDLQVLGEERDVVIKQAAAAGVLLTFTGSSGTLIPKDTAIPNPSTGISYLTKNDITLGQKNPDLNVSGISNLQDLSIADTVWAECETPGSIGNCGVNTITGKPAIAGVNSVTNLSPAQGGTDIESDSIYRERIRNYISILNLGTESFYEAVCKVIEPRVLRVRVKKDYSGYDAIKIILVNESGSAFGKEDLNFIASEVSLRHRAYTKVTCTNIGYTMISVKERVKLKSGFTLDQVYTATADALAGYFNWKSWEFGKPISIDNVFQVCDNVQGVEDVELNTFLINGGTPRNASVIQTLFNQVVTSDSSSTITDSSAVYTPDSLIGKYVRVINGTGAGQTRQIIANTSTQITILGTWDIIPTAGTLFSVVELYILSSRTQLAIDPDSIPYFFGLEVTDITKPLQPVTKRVQNIKQTNIQQQQQQNQA
jgi:uncharacterized phage protein gp47/JayE